MEPHQPRNKSSVNSVESIFRRKCAAYLAVFGRDGERTPAQKIVMDDMEARGYIHQSTMVPNKEGIVQDMKMEAAEGMRIHVLQTKNLIRLGYEASIAESSKRKPKIKQ